VRQLQSVLKQAILHATGPVLAPDFLPAEVLDARPAMRATQNQHAPEQAVVDPLGSLVERGLQSGSHELHAETISYVEKILLTRVLRHTGGNQSHAAKILGITRGSLRNKIRHLLISIDPVVSVEGMTDAEAGVALSDSS
jgi:two-component system nitrogen regulation response regulator GlnG